MLCSKNTGSSQLLGIESVREEACEDVRERAMSAQLVWEERLSWRKAVTPQLAWNRPVHRWFVYPHSFDKQLVDDLLQEMGLGAASNVWDPFLGAGTTVLACKERGIASYGSDLLPLSVLVSQAKLKDYDADNLRAAAEKLVYRIQKGTVDRFAEIPVVRKALSGRIRARVSSLLNQIEDMDEQCRLFFMTALIGILGDLGQAVKSGGWLRLDGDRRVHDADVKKLFLQRVEYMLADVRIAQAEQRHTVTTAVWLGDARTTRLEEPVHGIITSPPYLNRHDYTRVFALELALVSVANADELKAIRYSSLRSHVEAKAPSLPLNNYREPEALRHCLTEIEQRSTEDRRVPNMIRGYFEDLYLVLRNVRENLVPGGRAAFVLGDVRFSGVMIPVMDLLIELGQSTDLEPEKVIVVRYRGNSSQQMRTYGRERAKESVGIFRRA